MNARYAAMAAASAASRNRAALGIPAAEITGPLSAARAGSAGSGGQFPARPLEQHGRRSRCAEQESLAVVASHRAQEVQLLLGLDSLAKRLHPQRVREEDHRGDDRGVAVVASQLRDEAPVELEDVD